MNLYTQLCTEALKQVGRPDIPPGHLEGYMRLQYGTLNHLPRETFIDEARDLVSCYDDNPELHALNAESFGL